MAGYAKQRSNWQDFPVTSTPITAANLNGLETALYNTKHNNLADLAVDYGADNTGVVDAASVLNSALSDAAAGTAGAGVYLGPGTFKIASGISVPVNSTKHLEIAGAGIGQTTINYTGTGYCFTLGGGTTGTEARYQLIRDLTVTGCPGGVKFNSASMNGLLRVRVKLGSLGTSFCVAFAPGDGSIFNFYNLIKHCWFEGSTAASDTGIYLQSTTGNGANSNWIEHCYFSILNACVDIDGGDSNVVRECELNGTTSIGVQIRNNAVYNKVKANQFDGPATAVSITTSTPADNIVSDNTGSGTILNSGTRTRLGPNPGLTLTDTGTTSVLLDGNELGYAEITASVTATVVAEASAPTVITAPAVTTTGPVFVEFYAPFVTAPATTGQATILNLWDGATNLGRIANFTAEAAVGNDIHPCYVRVKVSPSNGSHTYAIKAWATATTAGSVGAGAGGAGVSMPASIRVVKA